jgi:hypothetical protein
MDIEAISLLLSVLGPLIAIQVHQWKLNSDQRKEIVEKQKQIDEIDKTVQIVATLIYDRETARKLMVHLAMENPGEVSKVIRDIEKRLNKIEDILQLMASKRNLEKIIDGKIRTIGDSQKKP